MNQVLRELKSSQDWYDPWGTAMSLAFTICTELDLRDESTPSGLRYSASILGPHHDNEYLQSIVEGHTSEDLFKAGEILDRYLDLLKRHDRDY